MINRFWVDGQQIVPSIGFGVDDANDPSQGLFTAANFPGASTAQLGNAESLFALLTGRVTVSAARPTSTRPTNQYVYLGNRRQTGSLNEFSFYGQDSWRVSPTLTLNGGLRWDIQMAFSPNNSIMSRSFSRMPAASPAWTPMAGAVLHARRDRRRGADFVEFPQGSSAYNTDWNNFAPNVGVAWRPNVAERLSAHAAGRPRSVDAARRLLGGLQPRGLWRLRRAIRRQSRQLDERDPERRAGNLVTDGPAIRSTLRRRAGSALPTIPTSAAYPIGDGRPRRQHQHLRAGHPVASARTTRSGSSARSRATWRSRSATSARVA